MNQQNPFKWRHYSSDIILLCVRWYLRYCLSYRNLEEMMNERGLKIDHTTIYRWIQLYGSDLKKKVQSFLKQPNDSWKVDETYIKIKGKWHYFYRAIDFNGKTIDFYLSEKRDEAAALTIFKKLSTVGEPRVINVDKHAPYHFSMGYHCLETSRNTIDGIESMYMIFKGQIKTLLDVNAYDVKIFIECLFEVSDLAA